MLPKKHRLSRLGILDIKRRFRPRSTSFGLIYISPGSGRATVITTKKIDPRAVVRNRLRRRFYHLLKKIDFSHTDLIFYPTKSTINLSETELHSQITKFLNNQ